MIGIGNKPYLRGEGPGLSWDEGVPMNFIEIGKWAWSPSRKNASLTVQLYRNDNDPDQSGKIEVKAGEKIEITPQFRLSKYFAYHLASMSSINRGTLIQKITPYSTGSGKIQR